MFVGGSEDGTIFKGDMGDKGVASLHPGWNVLDMNGEFEDGFQMEGGPLAVSIDEADFSHYTGSKLGLYIHATNSKKIVLPDTIKEIPERFLGGIFGLQEVVLSKNTKIIGLSAFKNCQNLSKCVLPEGLKEIQDEAFIDTSLERLILPKSIEKLGKNVFTIYVVSMYSEIPIVRFQSLEPPVLDIDSFYQGTRIEVPMAAVETYKNIPGWKEKFGDNIVGY